MKPAVEIDRTSSGTPGPRSNSYNFVPVRDFARAQGAPCPIASMPEIPFDRARTVILRLRDRMRAFRTSTADFDDRALFAIKEGLGQIYLDVSKKLAPDDFARDLKKLDRAAECRACARIDACPAAWEPLAGDVFGRDDGAVRAILASLEGRVLDVGGGDAGYLAPLADRAARGLLDYTSVDPDAGRLALLASRCPFARTVVGRGEDLGPQLGAFDHVLFLRSVNHLEDPARAFARAAGLIRPGGTLLLVDNVAFGLVRAFDHAARAERATANLLEHRHNLGAGEVAAIVARLGLPLDLALRRDIGPSTSNQWILRYVRAAGAEA